MELTPGPGEPPLGPYRALPFPRWLAGLLEAAGTPAEGPRLIGIDGRGGAGKTTLAQRLADAVPRAAVVHTDDLAWHHSILGWDDLLIDHIITPLRRGGAVDYRPPGWITHDRPGSIRIPAGCGTVIIEGTGTIRRETAAAFEATVWIQADYGEMRRRAIDRDVATGVNGDRAEATAFWEDWQQEEVPFLRDQRPWDAATSVVAGTETVPVEDDGIAVAGEPAR